MCAREVLDPPPAGVPVIHTLVTLSSVPGLTLLLPEIAIKLPDNPNNGYDAGVAAAQINAAADPAATIEV